MKAIVGEVFDGAVLTAVRRRTVTVIASRCARASRAIATVNDDRTRATIKAERRDTGPPSGVGYGRRRRRTGEARLRSNPISEWRLAHATPACETTSTS